MWILLVIFSLWIIGGILLSTDGKHPATRWAATIAFVGSCGFLAGAIEDFFLTPYLNNPPAYQPLLRGVVSFFSVTCQLGLPVSFFFYALAATTLFSKNARRLLMAAILLPIPLFLGLTPLYPVVSFHYGWLTLWAGPVLFLTAVMLLFSYWKEKDSLIKRQTRINTIILLLPIFYAFFTMYLLRFLDFQEAWRYNILLIFLIFFIFIIFGLRQGILGIRLRVEAQRIDSTMRAILTGVSFVNHTIKNELGKINLYVQKIENQLPTDLQSTVDKDLSVIRSSTDHVLQMITRIQGTMEDKALTEETLNLPAWLKQFAEEWSPLLSNRQISLSLDTQWAGTLLCDPVHLREALNNLVQNSLDALPPGGTIMIKLFKEQKNVVIGIQDDGSGIEPFYLSRVIEPFFSTKEHRQNFGLGLTYCFTVMRKHAGMLEIYSEKSKGTTVLLLFPPFRWKG